MKMIFVESNSWVKASLSNYVTLMGIPCYLHGADCGREDGPSFGVGLAEHIRVQGAVEGDATSDLPTIAHEKLKLKKLRKCTKC